MSLFDDIYRQMSQQERLDESEARWEHTVVNRMVSKLGIGHVRKALHDRSRAEGADNLLNMSAFRSMFGEFPMHIETTRLRKVPMPETEGLTAANYRVELCKRYWEPSRFKSFNRVPVVDLFNSLLSSLPEEVLGGRPAGLVFPRKGCKYGMLIHNDASERFWNSGSAWVYKGTEANPRQQYLQPFDEVLSAIQESGWKPF